MPDQKEHTKAKEELIINLEVSKAPIALLLRHKSDAERGITANGVNEIRRVFGKDISYISAKFVEHGSRKIIEEIALKRMDGSTEKREPSSKETEALVGIKNTFTSEKSIVVPWSDIEPLQDVLRKKNNKSVRGEVADLRTGESRPMTDEEIAEFLDDMINDYPGFDSIVDHSLLPEIERILKDLMREFFEDK